MEDPDIPNCPFCPFSDHDSQFVAQHIDFCHPELGIPENSHDRFEIPPEEPQSQTASDEDYAEKYVDCPHGCGEIVAKSELASHLDLHVAEEIALEDSGAVQTESQNVDSDAHKFDEFLEDKYTPLKGRDRKEYTQRAAPSKRNRSWSPAGFGSVPADGVRRLGVGFINLRISYTDEYSVQNWALMPMRRRCRRGLERCSRGVERPPRPIRSPQMVP